LQQESLGPEEVMAEEIMAFRMTKGKVDELRASDRSGMYEPPQESICVLEDGME
jgi:hypothetical protein